MKWSFLVIFLIVVAPKISFSQEVKKLADNKYLYKPHADAKKQLNDALIAAQKNHRHVLVVVGGDWSYWSRLMWAYTIKNHSWNKNYQLVYINFSPANKNESILTELKVPKDSGYPILVVLDETGKNLITTDTDNIKADQTAYDEELLTAFMEKWLTYK